MGHAHLPAGSPGGTGGRFRANDASKSDDLAPIVTGENNPCIELAKRRQIDLLWRSSSIEVAVTFPETEEIFNGVSPVGEQQTKIRVVNNLKHAWQFLFDNAGWPIDWQYMSEYNRLAGDGIIPDPGMMRSTSVAITGTEYVPDIPTLDSVRETIAGDLRQEDPVERAIGLFCHACRGQWFANGNKRTATMAANHQLIHDRAGIFSLPPQRMGGEFRDLLIDYYESGDRIRFSQWLCYHAIGLLPDGLTAAERDHAD